MPIAREAGIDPSLFPMRTIRGPSGITRARLCPIDIDMFGHRIATEILVLETNIVLVLLGRHDVFLAFQFGFDERGNTLLVEPY